MTQSHDQAPDAGEPGFEVQPTAGYVYQEQPTHAYEQPVAPPYPVVYGYPVVPTAMAYGQVQRPGVATAAAVLAFVQAGITAIATLLMFVSLFDSGFESGRLVIQTLAVLAAGVGVGLLIAGGVRITSGSDRTMLMVASVLQFVICAYYIVVFATLPDSSLGPDARSFDGDVDGVRGVFIFFAVMFAVMPTISLSLSQSRSVTDFLAARRR